MPAFVSVTGAVNLAIWRGASTLRRQGLNSALSSKQSHWVSGAGRSATGGGAVCVWGEWLRFFGMTIWNIGSCPCTCWMIPHLQWAPEPHSDTQPWLQANGAPFQSHVTKWGTLNYVSRAPLWELEEASHPCVSLGKGLKTFLVGGTLRHTVSFSWVCWLSVAVI